MERKAVHRGRLKIWCYVVVLVVLFVFLLACTKTTEEEGTASSPQSQQHVMQGKELFVSYCIHCHGPSGVGDGFNALYLDPRPRDLTDSVEVFMGELTNNDIYETILSRDIMDPEEAERLLDEALENDTELPFLIPPAMPTFKYTLSDAERWALVAYLRTLHKNDAPPIETHPSVSTTRPSSPVWQAPSWDLADDERTALVARGKFLFTDKYNCIGCHTIAGYGGKVGPDLSQSGYRLTADWTYQWISNPQAIAPDTKMPNLGLSQDEAKAITLYLGTLLPNVS